jgi:hypothetical protein
MRVTGLLSRAFLESLGNKVYRCKICGQEIYFQAETPKAKTVRYHFYNKHREIYLIAYKCMKGDIEYCELLEMIKNKYNKEGGKNE